MTQTIIVRKFPGKPNKHNRRAIIPRKIFKRSYTISLIDEIEMTVKGIKNAINPSKKTFRLVFSRRENSSDQNLMRCNNRIERKIPHDKSDYLVNGRRKKERKEKKERRSS